MHRNDRIRLHKRLRKQWRANRDHLIAEILRQAPSLTVDEARVLADKHMGYSAIPTHFKREIQKRHSRGNG